MKKLATITAIILIIFLIMGCDKYNRNQYIGDWDFEVRRFFWMNDTGPYVNDTIYYIGKISREGAANQLKIEFTDNESFLCDIDESGKISKDYENWHYYTRGEFEGNDKVHIKHGYHGLGSGREFTISGIKKKGGKK